MIKITPIITFWSPILQLVIFLGIIEVFVTFQSLRGVAHS